MAVKTIAMTGSTGFVGTHLFKAFDDYGHTVIRVTRSDLSQGPEFLAKKLSGADIVVNLAGAPIIGRWTGNYKKEIYSSRVVSTTRLVEAFGLMSSKPSLFISTSAVGFYAEDGRQTEERFVHATDFLGEVTAGWEEAAMKANSLGVRTVIFRFGIVLGKGGGVLAKMRLPFMLGMGAVIGDGSQAFSWVQIKDLERAYMTAISDTSWKGVYNLTSPNPTTNAGFTKALGKALNRPALLSIPSFVLRIQLGEGSEVLTKGQEVYPQRLVSAGFKFQYPDIESALRDSV